jgi:hypothetical protein
MTMDEINKNAAAIASYCLRHRKKTIRIRFESSKTASPVTRKSQTPFTKQPIKSQQQNNIDGVANATINMKKGIKTTHVPLAFIPSSLALKGGVVWSAGSRRFVGGCRRHG